jgi:hypothetical protein
MTSWSSASHLQWTPRWVRWEMDGLFSIMCYICWILCCYCNSRCLAWHNCKLRSMVCHIGICQLLVSYRLHTCPCIATSKVFMMFDELFEEARRKINHVKYFWRNYASSLNQHSAAGWPVKRVVWRCPKMLAKHAFSKYKIPQTKIIHLI